MNNLFMLGSSFGADPKGSMSFLMGGDNLFGNFEIGDQDEDDDFDDIKASDAIDYADINEAVPEEEHEPSPYFTNVPFVASSPEPLLAKSTLQFHSIVKTEPAPETAKLQQMEIEKEIQEKERMKQEIAKEREREKQAAEKAKEDKEKEREREKEKEKEKEKMKDAAEQLPSVILPPLVVSVLAGEVSEATPAVHQICSTLRGPNGPILKFSEIFVPDVKIPLPKSSHKLNKQDVVEEVEPQIDEAELFEKVEDIWVSKPWDGVFPTEHDSKMDVDGTMHEEIGQSMKNAEEAQQLAQEANFTSVAQSALVGVQLRHWEEDILWDEGENGKRPPVPSGFMLKELVHSSAGDDMMEEALPALIESTAALEITSIQPVYKMGPVPFQPSTGSLRESRDHDHEQPPPPPPEPIEILRPLLEKKKSEWSLFPVLNEDVDKGTWLEAVIWDDDHIPAAAASTPLLLDLNDKEMLFSENIKQPVIEKPPELPPPPEEKTPRGRKRRTKRDLSEIESIIGEGTEQQENLDEFNYSMDTFYSGAGKSRVRQKNMGRAIVQHSLPALKLSAFRTHLTPEELRLYHRPRTKYPPRKKIKIMPNLGNTQSARQSKSRSRKPSTTIRRMRDLSAREGRIVLAEYLEETPPLIMNVGMGTKLINYYRKASSTDVSPGEKDDGETVYLEQTDESPFLGDVRPGQMIQSLDNNLFRVPIVQHEAPMVDFLLIRSKDNKAYIREIPALYAVGQTQPLTEVPAPNSRSANNFVKNRLQAFIYRLFKSRQNSQPRLRIADVCAAFPDHSETSIRKRLKDCADFQRGGDDSGWWTVKKDFELPSEEELRSLLSPESVCAYESMLAGIQHLSDMGIDNLTNAAGAPAAIQQLIQDVPRIADTAEFVREELLLTPWNITSNYISVMQGKGMLQLSGLGDPTRCGDGFSYMRVPHKVFMVQQQQKASQPKQSVTGTDADLRKLSLENSRLVLLKFGVSDEVISQLTRWERIDLVRKKSSAAAAAGDDPSLCKFARGARHSVHQQQQQYKDECQEIFDRHMQFLSEEAPDVSSDEESDEEIMAANPELKDLAGEMEDLLEASATNNAKTLSQRPSSLLAMNKRQRLEANIDEEDDAKEFAAFMESEIKKTGPPSPPAQPQKPVIKTIIIDKDKDANPLSMELPITAVPGNIFATPAAPSSKGSNGSKKKYIKRTVTKRAPDGTYTRTVEIIRDPEQIQEILKKKEKKNMKRNKAPLTPEEEAKKIQIRKERRRLQEKLRRLKRNKEKQRIFKERMLNGSFDGSLPNSKVQLRCGACGMWGHMRTNRNCPFFTEPANPPVPPPRRSSSSSSSSGSSSSAASSQPTAAKVGSMVKVEGTKLRFSKAAIAGTEPAKTEETASANGASSGGGTSPGESLILRISRKDLPKKRKATAVTEPGYMLHPPKLRRQRQYKAGRGAGVELANLLEKAWTRVTSHQFALPFSRPVTAKEAPDYFDIVKRPMDLAAIKEKIRTFQYLSRQDMMADMKLIQTNCWEYNRLRNPHLPPMADLLVTICEDAFKEVDSELKELEDLLNPKKQGQENLSLSSSEPSAKKLRISRSKIKPSSSASTPAATPPATPTIPSSVQTVPSPTPTVSTTFTAITTPLPPSADSEQKLPPVRIRIKRESVEHM